jgi:hypothetical protein
MAKKNKVPVTAEPERSTLENTAAALEYREPSVEQVADGAVQRLQSCKHKIDALSCRLFGDTKIEEQRILMPIIKTFRSRVFDVAGLAERLEMELDELARRLLKD